MGEKKGNNHEQEEQQPKDDKGRKVIANEMYEFRKEMKKFRKKMKKEMKNEIAKLTLQNRIKCRNSTIQTPTPKQEEMVTSTPITKEYNINDILSAPIININISKGIVDEILLHLLDNIVDPINSIESRIVEMVSKLDSKYPFLSEMNPSIAKLLIELIDVMPEAYDKTFDEVYPYVYNNGTSYMSLIAYYFLRVSSRMVVLKNINYRDVALSEGDNKNIDSIIREVNILQYMESKYGDIVRYAVWGMIESDIHESNMSIIKDVEEFISLNHIDDIKLALTKLLELYHVTDYSLIENPLIENNETIRSLLSIIVDELDMQFNIDRILLVIDEIRWALDGRRTIFGTDNKEVIERVISRLETRYNTKTEEVKFTSILSSFELPKEVEVSNTETVRVDPVNIMKEVTPFLDLMEGRQAVIIDHDIQYDGISSLDATKLDIPDDIENIFNNFKGE